MAGDGKKKYRHLGKPQTTPLQPSTMPFEDRRLEETLIQLNLELSHLFKTFWQKGSRNLDVPESLQSSFGRTIKSAEMVEGRTDEEDEVKTANWARIGYAIPSNRGHAHDSGEDFCRTQDVVHWIFRP